MTRQELLDLGKSLAGLGLSGKDRLRRAWSRGLNLCGAPMGYVGIANLNVGYFDTMAEEIRKELANPDFCKHGHYKPQRVGLKDEFNECGECDFEELQEMAKELRW